MKKINISILLSLLFSFMLWAQSNNSYLIKAGKVFNSEKGVFVKNQQILVQGKVIKKIADKIKVDKTTKIIDLTDYTVLPGLIDSHTHILEQFAMNKNNTAGTLENIITKDDAYRALRSVELLKSYITSGFTTIKDVGNSGKFLDVSLKHAISDGLIVGPRIIAAGPIMSSVGGQFPGISSDYDFIPATEYRIIKGPDDARFAVREHINYGVDAIKICADNTPNNTALTFEEIKAIVETAHRFNKKVSAHASKTLSITDALNAGIDGIDHGYGISDDLLKVMAQKGTYLIPTDYHVAPIGIKYHALNGWTKQRINKLKKKLNHRLNFAINNNVKIAFGADIYVDFNVPRGDAAKNVFNAYLDAGASANQILQYATYNAADFLGYKNKLGVIKSGATADIVAFKGDLEKDFNNIFNDADLVIKNGKIIINKITPLQGNK